MPGMVLRTGLLTRAVTGRKVILPRHGRPRDRGPRDAVAYLLEGFGNVKITVVGTGYVGLVTGTCLAESGNDVICVDKVASKIAMLERVELPIYEPGLGELV